MRPHEDLLFGSYVVWSRAEMRRAGPRWVVSATPPDATAIYEARTAEQPTTEFIVVDLLHHWGKRVTLYPRAYRLRNMLPRGCR